MGKSEGGGSAEGCATAIATGIVVVVAMIAVIPKQAWIVIGILVGCVFLGWAVAAGAGFVDRQPSAAADREHKARAAEAAAARRAREEQARREKQWRVDTLGRKYAARVESALASIERVAASEAARAGWLGGVDFTADIRSISESYQKAYALRKVADELSALARPNDDDRRLLADAKSTMNSLDRRATERVELIGKCAKEARLIDESLRKEREDARTAEQRAELHGKLSALLYGAEATPDIAAVDSGADRVMARVAAYQEIKKQILAARDWEGA